MNAVRRLAAAGSGGAWIAPLTPMPSTMIRPSACPSGVPKCHRALQFEGRNWCKEQRLTICRKMRPLRFKLGPAPSAQLDPCHLIDRSFASNSQGILDTTLIAVLSDTSAGHGNPD